MTRCDRGAGNEYVLRPLGGLVSLLVIVAVAFVLGLGAAMSNTGIYL